MTPTPPRLLSVIVPAYNEERFIGELLARVAAVDVSALGFATEVIVVDDGSTDRTAEIAEDHRPARLIRIPTRGGKGRAVRAGLDAASGELIVIQDADLEYAPSDYLPMLRRFLAGDVDAVYGSRYLRGGRRPRQSLAAYLGGRSLNLVGWLFTGRRLTDVASALKLFRREQLAGLRLKTDGFELEHEITARLLAQGRAIGEVPVGYFPRTREEGKKIGVRDWAIAVVTFFRYRHG